MAETFEPNTVVEILDGPVFKEVGVGIGTGDATLEIVGGTKGLVIWQGNDKSEVFGGERDFVIVQLITSSISLPFRVKLPATSVRKL